MITCQHARHLFDRYLDGDLSPSLQAELHAHQLSCSTCQNELAMLEVCGDVVALDHCEPKLSDSFTDRVLLARRAQVAARPRGWSRRILFVGSPMAAAASILLAIMVITPPAPQSKTVTAGKTEALPSRYQNVVKLVAEPRLESEQARRELEETPQMPEVGFVGRMVATFLEQTQDKVDGVRSSAAELELIVRQGFSDARAKLVDQRPGTRHQRAASEAAGERTPSEFDFLRPPYPAAEPSSDELTTDPTLLDPV